jgi:hypothetical protein
MGKFIIKIMYKGKVFKYCFNVEELSDIDVVHYDILIGTKDKTYYLARHHCIIKTKYNKLYVPETSRNPPVDTSNIIIQTVNNLYTIPIHAIGAFDIIPKNKTFKLFFDIDS